MANGKWTKKELLSRPVKHIDITRFDGRQIVDSYRDMAYSSRTLAQAADIYSMMLKDKECAVILTLAGSLISAGLKKAIYNFMHGIGVEEDVRSWFPFKVPKPTVPRNKIEKALRTRS